MYKCFISVDRFTTIYKVFRIFPFFSQGKQLSDIKFRYITAMYFLEMYITS
jgi:hypothetical protein